MVVSVACGSFAGFLFAYGYNEDFYRLWPFVPRRTVREYVDTLKEYLGSFQRASTMPTNVSAANLIELRGSEELRRCITHLMTETVYWEPPNLRPAGFVRGLEANGPAGDFNNNNGPQPSAR